MNLAYKYNLYILALAIFGIPLIVSLSSYGQPPMEQNSPVMKTDLRDCYYRWGDSPLDENGIPLWTYQNIPDPEWKFIDHIICEVNGILLSVPFVDFEGPDSCGIINSRVLKAPDFSTARFYQPNELNIDLNMVSWDRFCVSFCMNGPSGSGLWQTPHAIPDKCSIYGGA